MLHYQASIKASIRKKIVNKKEFYKNYKINKIFIYE